MMLKKQKTTDEILKACDQKAGRQAFKIYILGSQSLWVRRLRKLPKTSPTQPNS